MSYSTIGSPHSENLVIPPLLNGATPDAVSSNGNHDAPRGLPEESDILAEYEAFLRSKINLSRRAGMDVDGDDLHPSLYPHQRDAVQWAARQGRALIAMRFGLGKTRIAIELLRIIHERTGKPVLVICPLGVKHQFQEEDGPALGIRFQYVRTNAEVLAADTPYLITNYERMRDGNISPEHFVAVNLDEGNVLRSLGSKTYQTFLQLFADTPYRFVCTATPSPNNYKEIIYYAQWLGIMDSGQALTRWFKRDSSKAGNLTLHPHHERSFWMWVSSWSLFLNKPSDLGYSDEGYDIPDLRIHWHRITTDHERAWEMVDNYGQRHLLMDSATGISASVREKRDTLDRRVKKAAEIVAAGNPDQHWLIWHHLEDERRAIEVAIPDSVSVYGSQDLELREQRILDFTHGKYRMLAVKPEIAGSGCNFQRHCHSNVFVGVRYQFDEMIQAIHRTHRFQQQYPVDVHIIHTDAEDHVVEVIKNKWAQHDQLTARMSKIIRDYGLSHEAMKSDLQRSIGVERKEVKGKWFTAINNDCVAEVQKLADNSVDLIHSSIPFSDHFEYSASYNDFGHNAGDAGFWRQMDYLTPHLLRVLKPGRIAAIHVKDRLLYGHQNGLGVMSVNPFSDECVAHFRQHGFIFFGRITIATDVVRENASTYRLGWSENTKDSTKMGVGLPEYLLLFRKIQTDRTRSYADEPVTKDKATYTRAQWQIDAHSFWRSSGNRLLQPQEIADLKPEQLVGMETGQIYRWWQAYNQQTVYDYQHHVEIGQGLEEEGRLPSAFMVVPPQAPDHASDHIWTDIVFMRTLNSNQSRGRQENHVCPLPFDIVERVINRYSNPDELVFDPFAGLFTVPYVAIKLGRCALGTELSPEYFHWGVKYCQEAEIKRQAPTLFDLMEVEQ